MKSKTFTGIYFVILFVFLGAIQEVYIGKLVQEYPPILAMTVTILYAFFFFISKNGRSTYSKLKRKMPLRLLILLNISSLLSWLGFFLSLKYIEPAISGSICFYLGPVLTTYYQYFNKYETHSIKRSDLISSIGLFVGLLILVTIAIQGESGMGQTPTSDSALGIFWAIVSAIGIVGNTIYSKSLNELQFNASDVMVVRFILLLLVGFSVSFINNSSFQILADRAGELLVISVVTVIVPLYILQKGIEITKPLTVSLLLAGMPILTFILQLFDDRLMASYQSLLGIIFCALFQIYGSASRIKLNS
jgi:drug/metabolite transporter (DMT)-like permease